MSATHQDLGTRLAEIKGAQRIKSFCYTCPWQCPTEVFVREGQIVYQKGNPEAPNNIGCAPIPRASPGNSSASAGTRPSSSSPASSRAFVTSGALRPWP
jgi:hypothetical protein